MANRKPVQYIQFYTDGSAARQPEIRPLKKKNPAPKPRKAPRVKYVFYVCPVALCGILAAAVLLILMAVGTVKLVGAKQEQEAMAQYVSRLEWENRMKEEAYEASLDLEQLRRQALALGMVPQDQVRHMEISVGNNE